MSIMYLVSLSIASAETTHYLLDKGQWDRVHAKDPQSGIVTVGIEASRVIAEMMDKRENIPFFTCFMDLLDYMKAHKVTKIEDELQDIDFEGQAYAATEESKPSNPEDFVCPECGSDQVEAHVWVKANTSEQVSEDEGDYFCPECESNISRLETRGNFVPEHTEPKEMETALPEEPE